MPSDLRNPNWRFIQLLGVSEGMTDLTCTPKQETSYNFDYSIEQSLVHAVISNPAPTWQSVSLTTTLALLHHIESTISK